MANFIHILTIFLAFTVCYAQDGVLEIRPSQRELLVKDGMSQDLVCSVNTEEKGTKLEWIIPSEEGVVRLEQTEVIAGAKFRLQHSLKINSFSGVNNGTYVCKLMKGDKETSSSQISLYPVKEDKTEPTFHHGNKTAALACSISSEGKDSDIRSVEWLKNDTKVSDLKESNRFVEKNASLIINNPTRDDAGLYIARFVVAEMKHPYDCEVRYTAGPLVRDFEKSKNLIQGDNMELQCQVMGFPRAMVTWYKDKQLLNISKGETKHVIQSPLNGYLNARLQIKGVEFSDAGDYTCEAYSQFFNETSAKTITVRVKDKLAALWPFLGIVGEVIILCTIIFIYEKRRNKQAEQDDTTAQEADGAAPDKKEGLRHRNTNNPTA